MFVQGEEWIPCKNDFNIVHLLILKMNTKFCCRCKQTLVKTKFNKCASNKSGLQTVCKDCERDRRLAKVRGDDSVRECQYCKNQKSTRQFNLNPATKECRKICTSCEKLDLGDQRLCYTCVIVKNIDDFPLAKGRIDTKCKDCKYAISKKYKDDNKEQISEYNKTYQRKRNLEKTKAAKKLEQEKRRIYYQENKSKINQQNRERRKKDKHFNLRHNLSSRIAKALNDNIKSENTMSLIGCSIEEFKFHIESQFEDGMSWDNYGRLNKTKSKKYWEIDHIIPCASFDLSVPEEQVKCFNYRNTQPLWREDNIRKSDKLPSVYKKIRADPNNIYVQKQRNKLFVQEFGKMSIDIFTKEPSMKFRKTNVIRIKDDDGNVIKENKELVKRNIGVTLKEYNQTEAGKEQKKLAHEKRSKTMLERRKLITEKKCPGPVCKGKIQPVCNFTRRVAGDPYSAFQSYCKQCINEKKRILRAKK